MWVRAEIPPEVHIEYYVTLMEWYTGDDGSFSAYLRALNQAGVGRGQQLSRPLPEAKWRLPTEVRYVTDPDDPYLLELSRDHELGRDTQLRGALERSRLRELRQFLPAIAWDARGPVDPAHEWANPSGPVLDAFVRLEDAEPGEIIAFVRQYGPLMLCEHGRPAHHSPGVQQGEKWIWGCRPLQVEPVTWWHRYARQARAILEIGAKLHRGQLPDDGDWADALMVVPPRERNLEEDGQFLEYAIQIWISHGFVSPTFKWEGGHPRIELMGWGVLGAIACQLTFGLVRSEGMALCSGCKEWYTPKRRPNPNRRNYCPHCRSRSVPNRDAQRDWRERNSDSAG